MPKSIQLYLHVHQPWRVKPYDAFATGVDHNYWGPGDREIFLKVAHKSYLPTNRALLSMLQKHPEFKFSFSITGTMIEQCEAFMPELLESF
jgi:alpha-amylase